jgi:hypothetical protein
MLLLSTVWEAILRGEGVFQNGWAASIESADKDRDRDKGKCLKDEMGMNGRQLFLG